MLRAPVYQGIVDHRLHRFHGFLAGKDARVPRVFLTCAHPWLKVDSWFGVIGGSADAMIERLNRALRA